ncbi:MAG: preprotein translocase subunit SecG [Deltaproteobacteria bacterium]|nr:preprotein translocase subunit SecG [Deltaproteobacteria bacterium]
MHTFLVTLHVILCLLLVFVILMQPGKGADAASAFGGGASSQIFGAAGPGNVLTKGTGAIATLFMITSITLAFQSTKSNVTGGAIKGGFDDVLDDGGAGEGFGAGAPEGVPSPSTPEAPAPSTP